MVVVLVVGYVLKLVQCSLKYINLKKLWVAMTVLSVEVVQQLVLKRY